MSWAFEFAAKSRTKAIEEVDKYATQQSCLPPSIAEAIKDRIAAMPDGIEGDRAIYVQSNGHFDQASPTYGYSNGEAKFRVMLIGFLAALLLAAMPASAEDPTPKFGGCLANKTTCFAPTVSINVIAIALRDGTPTSTFDPGVGYGVTFPTLEGGRRVQPSALVSFAEYLRFGFACPLWTRGGLPENGQLLIGFGTDFGAAFNGGK